MPAREILFRTCPKPSAARLLALAALLPISALANALTAGTEDWSKVEPMLQKYCYDCHGGKKTKSGVDLKRLGSDPALLKEFELWNKVKEALKAGDMPPEKSTQFAPPEKDEVTKWLGHSLDEVVRANAGDPGIVTVRRLTNSEYSRTIRDLTGFDYGLADDFAPDGGGGEGFSNIGDVLFVSPQQLDKYFVAARKLADNATIMPGSGIEFHPQRVGLRGPVQLRAQAEQALYVWYQKMAEPFLPKDGEDFREEAYMLACWQWKHHEQTGAQSLEQLAKDAKLVLPFLENWWEMLNKTEPKSRFLDLTRVTWRELPGPDAAKPKEVPAEVTKKLLEIKAERRSWLGPEKNPGGGVQRRQQDSDGIRSYDFRSDVKGKPVVHLVLSDVADGNTGDWVTFENLTLHHGKKKELYADWLRTRLNADKQALAAPNADTAKLQPRIAEAEATLAKFGKDPRGKETKPGDIVAQAPVTITLPLPEDAFKVEGAGKLDISDPGADSATVQWWIYNDNPPDPHKVLPGILTVWKIRTTASGTTMREFEAMRTAFPDEYVRRLEEVARNFHRGGKGPGVYYLSDTQLGALIPPAEKQRWEKMSADWKLVRNKDANAQQGKEWDEAVKRHLADFATRAWRRPLTPEEITQLGEFYAAARARELDRESSCREVLVRLLVSPNFLFKIEDAAQPGERKLNAWELATRLSYFLWSSAPDDRLRQVATDGSLLKPEVLSTEVKRMMHDRRATALGEEFAGQWLKFNGFVKTANIDPNKFPEFTPELRRDMAREATEFFSHLIRDDRPVREILTADYTFLNDRLATFYGVPGVTGGDFRQVSVAAQGRGGLLGMGCVLAKTSYPHRTSPVLRGNWLLTSILGTPTPPPPNDVPKLDDSVSKAATLRTRLEAHRQNAACASCHDKIDPLGFALEGFDPIGRARTKDEAGLDIDNSGQIKNGPQFTGLAGLRTYLATREGEFNDLLCRKLVGYALGRIVLPTDQPLLETMRAELKKNDSHFSAAVLALVQSRQFQNRRNE
jgi:cytochrome c553